MGTPPVYGDLSARSEPALQANIYVKPMRQEKLLFLKQTPIFLINWWGDFIIKRYILCSWLGKIHYSNPSRDPSINQTSSDTGLVTEVTELISSHFNVTLLEIF